MHCWVSFIKALILIHLSKMMLLKENTVKFVILLILFCLRWGFLITYLTITYLINHLLSTPLGGEIPLWHLPLKVKFLFYLLRSLNVFLFFKTYLLLLISFPFVLLRVFLFTTLVLKKDTSYIFLRLITMWFLKITIFLSNLLLFFSFGFFFASCLFYCWSSIVIYFGSFSNVGAILNYGSP